MVRSREVALRVPKCPHIVIIHRFVPEAKNNGFSLENVESSAPVMNCNRCGFCLFNYTERRLLSVGERRRVRFGREIPRLASIHQRANLPGVGCGLVWGSILIREPVIDICILLY